MFGWRKKRDGFEWHDYVRTTILVRRAKRRQKVDDARAAAVDGLKDAGAAAAHGLNEAKGAAAEGFRRAGEMGQALGASGVSASARLIQRFWSGTGHVLSAARVSGAAGARALASRMLNVLAIITIPLLDRLSDRRTRTIVGAVGVAAALAVAYRGWIVGFDARTLFAAVLALLTLGPAVVAERQRDDVTHRPASRNKAAGAAAQSSASTPVSMKWLHPVIAWGGLAALVIFGLGTLINPEGFKPLPSTAAITHTAVAPTPQRPVPSGDIRGRARVISGDTLRIGRTIVRLDHVEAPESGQICTRENGKTWRCGEAARAALARYVSGARISCTLTHRTDADRLAHGDCRKGETDLAAALVRDGHVFAETGFFARHASLESEARENRRGLWSGEAQRPETFRATAWQAALEKAPKACPIKGRIASRDKFYVMPWMKGYDNVSIRTSRGERWFCSEEEALEAGWRPSGAT